MLDGREELLEQRGRGRVRARGGRRRAAAAIHAAAGEREKEGRGRMWQKRCAGTRDQVRVLYYNPRGGCVGPRGITMACTSTPGSIGGVPGNPGADGPEPPARTALLSRPYFATPPTIDVRIQAPALSRRKEDETETEA
jgi:hypothetical protein